MNEYINISSCDDDFDIHDCKATHIELKDNVLSFTFDDGFWVVKDNPYMDNNLHKSDKAMITLNLLDDEYADNYVIYLLTKKRNKDIRKALRLDELMALVNSEKAELEFLYHYKGFQSYIFECELWLKKKPYSKECVMIVESKGISYHWNNVLKNRIW